jgi:hypothetical protein
MIELESLAGVAPEVVPAESKFLLGINFSNLSKSHIELQKYWILAVNAALSARNHQLALGAHARQIKHKVNAKLSGRTKLGIVAIKLHIRKDLCNSLLHQEEHTRYLNPIQPSLDGFLFKRPHPVSTMNSMKSNKCLQKPD